MFQSTPLVVEGRCAGSSAIISCTVGFNPRPSLSRGDASTIRHRSIPALVFQSTPLVVEGRCATDACNYVFNKQFQSTPLVVEGRCKTYSTRRSPRRSFNPRPSLSRGDAKEVRCMKLSNDVSIHAPRCRGAMRTEDMGKTGDSEFQSTPLVVEGRCQQRSLWWSAPMSVSIHAPRCRGAMRFAGNP